MLNLRGFHLDGFSEQWPRRRTSFFFRSNQLFNPSRARFNYPKRPAVSLLSPLGDYWSFTSDIFIDVFAHST